MTGRLETLLCDVCGQIKYIPWNEWGNQVLTINTKDGSVRMCADCQKESISFRKNCARLVKDMYDTLECDDRK